VCRGHGGGRVVVLCRQGVLQSCRLRVMCMIQGTMLSEMRPRRGFCKQLRSNNDMSKNESGISSFSHDAVLCTVGSVTLCCVCH